MDSVLKLQFVISCLHKTAKYGLIMLQSSYSEVNVLNQTTDFIHNIDDDLQPPHLS